MAAQKPKATALVCVTSVYLADEGLIFPGETLPPVDKETADRLIEAGAVKEAEVEVQEPAAPADPIPKS